MFRDENGTRCSRWFTMVLVVLCAGLAGCGGGSGRSTVGISRAGSFIPSGTAASADMVRLTGSASGDLVTVNMVLSGPTSSNDLYSFAFDLVMGRPDLFELVPNSAAVGPALTVAAGQQRLALAAQNGARITVGVTKLGPGPGNGMATGDAVVASLTLRALRIGATSLRIAGSQSQGPAALDSAGVPVPSVAFDAGSATITAR